MFKITGIKKSEVETNKELVSVGMVLVYMDSENVEFWRVTEVTEDYFSAIDSEDFEETFYFEELQAGWKFKN